MTRVRQSVLRAFDACPQAGVWALEDDGWSTPEQALGTVFHAVAEAMLTQMRETGGDDQMIPTDAALTIMHEVCTDAMVPHLSDRQMRDLSIMVLQFSAQKWDAERIIALETGLSADIVCPDGETRTLTGRPDVLIADPPGGMIIVDFKSGWGKPPEPRDGNWDREDGRPYLSERGVFQLDTYGYMAMRNYPAVEECTLREFHARRNVIRQATLRRDEMEHVEHRLGILLQRFADTMAERRDPEPRPGAWCKAMCPRISECPIQHREMRRTGSIDTIDHAYEVADRYVVQYAQVGRDAAALKAWLDAAQVQAIPVGDAWVGWKEAPTDAAIATVHERHACPKCKAKRGAMCHRVGARNPHLSVQTHKERIALERPDLANSGGRSFGVHTANPAVAYITTQETA